MFEKIPYPDDLKERYELGKAQLQGLLDPAYEEVTNDANAVALFASLIDNINWVGFYYLREDKLVLGPFQGLPACSVLPAHKGVCWKAVDEKKPVYVDDVLSFPGHIACDAASRSELVVPIFRNGTVVKVLDIDSAVPDRFGETERNLIIECANTMSGL
ncbi:MAG: GAF domain-containing protein [Erysipelotrichales bacterium]|nr:GAF domain-containing protein [Erysipelotrichales bacterium]